MPEVGIRKMKQGLLACCVVVALAFCSVVAMGAVADSPTSNTAYAATKFKSAKIVDAGNKNKTVTKKTVNMALVGRSSTTFKVDYQPKKGAVKSVKWYSNSKKVATVSSKGKVTAKKKGTATIKAKLKMYKGKSRTLYVKVKVAEGGWQSNGRVTKAATCYKAGTKVVKSLDGWKSKNVSIPAGHKYVNGKCTACGDAGGVSIAKTAVSLATGAEGTKNSVKIDSSCFSKDSDYEGAKSFYKSSRPQADAYNAAFDSVGMNMKSFQYPDCGYTVIVAARHSGVDRNFCNWKGGKAVEKMKDSYLDNEKKNGAWKKVGTYYKGKTNGFSELKPGDVLIHVKGEEKGTGGDHARVYVGYDAVKSNAKYSDAEEGLWFCDGAYGKKLYPYLSTNTKSSNEFTVYRYGA